MKNNSLILKDSVQIKYNLRLHTVLPTYPTSDDFVFDCIQHYLSTTKKSAIDVNRILISKADLQTIYSEKLTDSIFVKRLKEVIKQMIDLGKVIKQSDDSLCIDQSAITSLYKIV